MHSEEDRATMEAIDAIERIRSFIVEHIPKARQLNVQNEDELIETGLLDSLGILDVVTYLEEEFALSVSDEELIPENFQSISTMATYVHMKKKSTPISH